MMNRKNLLESGFKWEWKEIPTKTAINLIENASLEDSKNLQGLWNNMLANAVTREVDIKNRWFSKSLFFNSLNIKDNEFEIIVDSLIKLNLIHTRDWNKEWMRDKTYTSFHMRRLLILITHLWYEFVKACKFK